MATSKTDPALRPNKGFHPLLERENPYLFIDACMQAWHDTDYANAHRHGVAAYAVTVIHPHESFEGAVEAVMYWHQIARLHPNLLVATSAEDVRRAKRDGRAAIIVAAQDGDWIGLQLHRLEAAYRLGLRILLPVYNASNHIGGGCLDRDDHGLTRFGETVVDECNRLGLLLDGSHVGPRATLDMMERTRQPFVFTHSNVKAIMDSPRNVTDEQIKACAATGGVVGLAPFGPFTLKRGSREWPSIKDFIEHIDYVAQLTGSVDHIGIGTDMSLGSYPYHEVNPWGEPAYLHSSSEYAGAVSGDVRSPKRALRDFNCYPQVLDFAAALLAHRYSESDVHKILGGNFLRVFDQVWKQEGLT
ncbi:MAG: membrane dipeptidase [Deltaproteobacteria bacterium]|nr:membrane dipeptidase [Deltaproteobacteria bacterium]